VKVQDNNWSLTMLHFQLLNISKNSVSLNLNLKSLVSDTLKLKCVYYLTQHVNCKNDWVKFAPCNV